MMNSPRKNFNTSKGFTLLEVMVALFILATISLSVNQVISSQINISVKHRTYALSNLCAADLVAQWQLERFYPQVGRHEGESKQLDINCYWRLDTQNTAIKNMQSGVLQIYSDSKREVPIGKYSIFLGL